MEYLKRTWAEINISALLHNFNLIKKNSNNKLIMPIVKANAYGHSGEEVALALDKIGADAFAVSNLEEALNLRKANIQKPILILGYTPADCAELLSENNLTQAVYSLEYAKLLSKGAKDKTLSVHIKIDTGMGRIGFNCRDNQLLGCDEIFKLYQIENLNVTGIFTHFCVADSINKKDKLFTEKQYSLFKNTIEHIKANGFDVGLTHCSNSAGIISHSDFISDILRPGIILYGLKPSNDVKLSGVKPVMTLKSVVSMVKNLKAGETVSYGRTFKAKKDMTVATVTAGYADGYPRLLSNKGEVLVKGQKAKIIGNICMDQFIIDVTCIDNISIGEEVILFGEEITADEVAKKCDTIGYEITSGITSRVPRVIIR